MPPPLIFALLFCMIGNWLGYSLQFQEPHLPRHDTITLGNNTVARIPPHQWWLTKSSPKTQHLQSLSRKIQTNNSLPAFNTLLNEWTGKSGTGLPTFIIRPINFIQHTPGFLFMFPAGDANQQQVYDMGVYDPYISYHLVQDLKSCCSTGGHFLDAGSYLGWYSLVMASMGCNVDAFESVPWYQSLAAYTNNELNPASVGHKIKTHSGTILAQKAERRTLVIPKEEVSFNTNATTGTTDLLDTKSEIEANCGERAHCYDVVTSTIDKELNLAQSKREEVNSCGMRLKVDGLESEIIAGAQDYMKGYKPKIVVLELNTKMKAMLASGDTGGEKSQTRMLASFLSLHYTPYLLFWETIKSYNWDAIQTTMLTSRYTGGLDQLMADCGNECVVYFVREG